MCTMANPRRARRLKPEQVLVAKKHQPKKVTKQSSKKRPKHSSVLHRKISLSRNIVLLLVLLGAIVAWCVAGGLYVLAKRSQQPPPLDTQAIIDHRQRIFESKYGTEQERLNEIDFADSVESDLRDYVLADYTRLKQNCHVNDEYVYVPRYRIERVVRGNFAVIVKDCGGEQKAILAKTSTGWAEVHSGNAVPSCDRTNQLHIPHGIAEMCTIEGVLYTNPTM